VRRNQHDGMKVVMDGHLVPTSSNSKIGGSLENFTLDAERWLAALYWCVRTSYGDDAAHAAADCWLRVFEERLVGLRNGNELLGFPPRAKSASEPEEERMPGQTLSTGNGESRTMA
jgi:hypothetical protein